MNDPSPTTAPTATPPPPTAGGGWRRHFRSRAWLVVVVPLMIYLPLLFGRTLIRRDLSQWIYPAQVFVGRALRTGQDFAWNPLVDTGLSTASNPLYGSFYPLNWLAFAAPSPVLMNLVFLLHLVGGGLGFFWLLQRLNVRPIAAAIAGVSWAMGGYITSMWTFGIYVPASAYAPWCGLGFLALASRSRPGIPLRQQLAGIAWAALPVGLAFLLGETFFALMCAMFGFGIACAAGADPSLRPDGGNPGVDVSGDARWPWRTWSRLCAGALVAMALASALGAAALLPAMRGRVDTERVGAMPLATAERGSFHPARLLEFATPGMTRLALEREPRATVAALGGIYPLVIEVYCGGVVLGLLLLAFDRRRAGSWMIAGIGALFLLVAMGGFAPVHRIFRVVVLPFSLMRLPEKYLVVVAAVVAVLAGLGAERLLARRDLARLPRRWLALLGLGALGHAGLYFFARAGAANGVTFPLADAASSGAWHGAGAVLVLALMWRFSQRRAKPIGVALIVVVAVDLAIAAMPTLRWDRPHDLTDPPPAARAVLDDARARGLVAPPRVYRQPQVTESVVKHARENLWRTALTLRENLAGIHGINVLPGYDAAISPRTGKILALGDGAVLRLLGVQYAVLAVDDPRHPPRPEGLTPMLEPQRGSWLYRVEDPLPRVYLADAAEVVVAGDNDAGVRQLLAPVVVRGRSALLSATDAAAARAQGILPAAAAATDSAGNCRLLSFANTRVEAECTATRPALAIFLERHAVGWSAAVNGAAAPIWRANLDFRAVPVAAGKNHIVLTFAPPGRSAGVATSGLSVLLVATLLVAGTRRKKASG